MIDYDDGNGGKNKNDGWIDKMIDYGWMMDAID